MPNVTRTVRSVGELRDWDQPSFADGDVPAWSADAGKFAGEPARYVHAQLTASASWAVAHNLGRHPTSILVEDTTGRAVRGQVTNLDANNLRIDFFAGGLPMAMPGYAYIA
jgi:hypothetical protein